MTAPAPIPRMRHTPTSQNHWLTHATSTTQPPPAQAAQPTTTPTDQAHPSKLEGPDQGSTCPCDSCPHCCCRDSDNNTQQPSVSDHA